MSGCGQLYKMPREISGLGNSTKPGYSVTHGIGSKKIESFRLDLLMPLWICRSIVIEDKDIE